MSKLTNVGALWTSARWGMSARKKSAAMMLALAPLAGLFATSAIAATYTWDPAHTTAGSAGDGVWDTATNNWATSGADVVWPNDTTSTAVFGVGSTAGNVTVGAPINVNGILFNTTSGGLNYLISASGGNSLTLAGTTPTINVVAGESPTINAPIAGTAGLTLNDGTNTGGLTLGGVNTYTGTTSILSGNLTLAAGGTLGSATNGLLLGNTGGTLLTAAGVTFNGNATIGSFNDTTQTAIDTLIVASGKVLTVNGAFTVGQVVSNPTTNQTLNTFTGTNTPGAGGEIDINGNVTIGANPGGGTKIQATVNLSNLNTLNINNPTGFLNIGCGTNIKGLLTLANNTNVINVSSISIATSGSGNSNGGSNLTLGNGTNTIEADSINIGAGKSQGNIIFASSAPATASVNISGTNGTGRSNIILDSESSGTGNGPSNLSLAGHSATVMAGNLVIGQDANGGGNATASVTFDTGTLDVNSLTLANGVSGAAIVTGNLTIGTTATSTGVLNVNSTFLLANQIGGTGAATGNFIINGGTANIFTNILNGSAAGKTVTTNITLNGGTLNMAGSSIGTAAAPITNVNLAATAGQSAVLENLGGAGINGAGLTDNGAGTLILAGTNTYTGDTTINAGSTLQIGSATLDGTLPSTTNITNNGNLNFARSNNASFAGNISGSGSVVQSGTGSTALGGTLSYTGPTTVSAGKLFINGSLASSAVTISGGTLGGNGTISANLALAAGQTLLAGGSTTDTSGVLTLGNLAISGGKLAFNIGTSSASSISAANATFTGAPTIAFNIAGTPVSGSNFTLLTGITSDGGVLGSLASSSVGRLTLTPSESGTSLIVTVTGQAANLVFNGGADGTTWDNQTTANFLNGATQDMFYAEDAVTFNDSNGGHYGVTLMGTLAPGSVTVNNSAGNYVFSGSGSITGSTGLTKAGSGSLTLANTGGNNYTGLTAVQNGTLILGNGGSLPSGGGISFGDGSGHSGTLDLGGNSATVSSITEAGGTTNVIGSSGSTASTLTFKTGTSTFSGIIRDVLGAGTSTVAVNVASGNLTLNGANTYSGGTTVAGVLNVGGSLGSGNVTVSGGGTLNMNAGGSLAATAQLADSGTVNLAGTPVTIGGLSGSGTLNLNGATLSVNGGGNFSGVIADGTTAGATLAVSNGTLTLSGTNTFTGDVSIQNGAIRAATSTAVGAITGGNVTVSNGGTFDIGAGAGANSLNFGSKVFKISGTGVPGEGALWNTGTVSQFNAYEFITLTGDATIGGGRFDLGRSAPSGVGDVLDLGGHTLTINMSTATGNQPMFGIQTGSTALAVTTVTGGQIIVNSGALDLENRTLVADDGTSKITFNTGTNMQFYQTTNGNTTDQGGNINRPMVFMGNNIIGPGSNTTSYTDSNFILMGNITLQSLGSGSPSTTIIGQMFLGGTIAESGTSASVTKLSNNTVTLSGAGNNWTGGTFIQAGTIQAGVANALPVNGSVTLGNGTASGAIDLNGFSVSVGGLATSGTGTANVIGSSSTTAPSTLVYAGTATASTFGGTIQDVIGSGNQVTSLSVTSGSLALTGANTFTGGTTINGGKLLVNNTSGSGTGTGNVILNGGLLGGTGTITGSVSGGSGAHSINPGATGANSVGTLTVGGLTTNSNTTLSFDLGSRTTGAAGDGTLPNGTSDLLAVAGNLTLNGGKLAITSQASTGNISLGYYKVVSYSGTLTGSTANITLPAVANNIAYTLDTSRDPGYLDVHRGFIGDATDDGVVDLNDLNTILNHLGVATTSWNNGNFDGAATIDLNDLNDVLNHLGTSIPAGSAIVADAEALVAAGSTSAVPEPATLGVAGFAAVALLLRRKRA